MKKLISAAKQALCDNNQLPFSVYSSIKEQHIVNVPVIKPLLIFVLNGVKELGKDNKIACPAGDFIFLSNRPVVDIRNIPKSDEYFALLIEFDFSDFRSIKRKQVTRKSFIRGNINSALEKTLQQFIEWSTYTPSDLWHYRKAEILQLMYHLGYEDVGSLVEPPSLSHRLHEIISDNIAGDVGMDNLASKLAMSESTLRRKLKSEGISLQEIKDRTKLGYGLHLVQTTIEPIGRIAECCGYQSQSRFTDRFKQLFGITPTELRKTKCLI